MFTFGAGVREWEWAIMLAPHERKDYLHFLYHGNKVSRMKGKETINLYPLLQTPVYACSRLPQNSRSAPQYVNTGATDPRIQLIPAPPTSLPSCCVIRMIIRTLSLGCCHFYPHLERGKNTTTPHICKQRCVCVSNPAH